MLVASSARILSAQTPTLAGIDINLTASPDPVVAGNNITYTITVTNVSSETISNLAVAVFYFPGPSQISFTAPPGWITYTSQITDVFLIGADHGVLLAGQSATFTLVDPIDATYTAGTICNRALVATPAALKVTDVCTTLLASPLPDLVLTNVASPERVVRSDQITYTITVTNDGATPASDVTLSDTLPLGTTFVSFTASSGWTTSAPAPGAIGKVTATTPTMPPASSATFTLVMQTGSPCISQTVDDFATVSTTSTEKTTENNWGWARARVVDCREAMLLLTKTADRSVARIGDAITYTLIATNAGPATANATLRDDLQSGLTLLSATATQGSCTGTQRIICSLGQIQENASATVTIVVRGVPGHPIWNSATVSGDNGFALSGTASNFVDAVASDIPTVSPVMLGLLGLALVASGWFIMKR